MVHKYTVYNGLSLIQMLLLKPTIPKIAHKRTHHENCVVITTAAQY